MKIHIDKGQITLMVIIVAIVLSVVIGITAVFFPDNYSRYLSSPEKILALFGVGLLTWVVCAIAGKAIRSSSSNSEED